MSPKPRVAREIMNRHNTSRRNHSVEFPADTKLKSLWKDLDLSSRMECTCFVSTELSKYMEFHLQRGSSRDRIQDRRIRTLLDLRRVSFLDSFPCICNSSHYVRQTFPVATS